MTVNYFVWDILKPLYKTTAPKATAKADTPIKQCLKNKKFFFIEIFLFFISFILSKYRYKLNYNKLIKI